MLRLGPSGKGLEGVPGPLPTALKGLGGALILLRWLFVLIQSWSSSDGSTNAAHPHGEFGSY